MLRNIIYAFINSPGKQTYTPGAPPGKVEGDEKSVPVDEGDFPTLREAAMMSQGIKGKPMILLYTQYSFLSINLKYK